MPSITDAIENFLNQLIEEKDELVISRNELADYFSCAPSQINYVLTTRFTLDRGYMVKSKRGGSGNITISRASHGDDYILSLLNDLADGVTLFRAEHILDRLFRDKILSARERELLLTAISDKSLSFPIDIKDKMRGQIVKEIIIKLLSM